MPHSFDPSLNPLSSRLSLKTPFPKAILFDYDGVLVSSEPIHLQAWMQLLGELGIPLSSEGVQTIQSHIGKTAPEILTLFLNRYKPNWKELKIDPQTLALRKNVHYLAIAKTQLSLYPGVLEGIQWLRSMKVATAIVSNAKRRELEGTMAVLGLLGSKDKPLFDVTVSRDDVPACKPDPLPYLFAASTLGVKTSECVAIEDSPTGLEAALMARIPTAAVLTTYPKAALESPIPGRPDLKPIEIFSSIEEFFQQLKEQSTSELPPIES